MLSIVDFLGSDIYSCKIKDAKIIAFSQEDLEDFVTTYNNNVKGPDKVSLLINREKYEKINDNKLAAYSNNWQTKTGFGTFLINEHILYLSNKTIDKFYEKNNNKLIKYLFSFYQKEFTIINLLKPYFFKYYSINNNEETAHQIISVTDLNQLTSLKELENFKQTLNCSLQTKYKKNYLLSLTHRAKNNKEVINIINNFFKEEIKTELKNEDYIFEEKEYMKIVFDEKAFMFKFGVKFKEVLQNFLNVLCVFNGYYIESEAIDEENKIYPLLNTPIFVEKEKVQLFKKWVGTMMEEFNATENFETDYHKAKKILKTIEEKLYLNNNLENNIEKSKTINSPKNFKI